MVKIVKLLVRKISEHPKKKKKKKKKKKNKPDVLVGIIVACQFFPGILHFNVLLYCFY